jgi:hypothetical protein
MTQHEYIFVAISVVLGLAMARLLHTAALLVRIHARVRHHWATTLWGVCILIYILQLWWVGWELRLVTDWSIIDFFALVIGSIFVYGAAELALPSYGFPILGQPGGAYGPEAEMVQVAVGRVHQLHDPGSLPDCLINSD